jgi:general secretion pathway protein H
MNKRGFTLMEIMIVLAIMSGLLVLGVRGFQNPGTNIRNVVRNLTVVIKEVRTQARLKGRTHRIVFNMGKTPKDIHTYSVESAEGQVLALTEKTLEEQANLSEDERPANPFQPNDRVLKKPKELPGKIYFGGIETSARPTSADKGVAYIYFSPEGLVEQSVIQITNRDKLTWSLIINPLTGQTDIVEKAISLKDLIKQ